MPKPIFQDNLQVIDKGAHDFHNFLAQFKSKNQRTNFAHKHPQQNISSHVLFEKSQFSHRNQSPSFNQEDFYENKSEFKHRSSLMENSGQISEDSRGFEIRKPYKLNSTPPAKFSQEDNIKNQHPGQLIIVKSAQELPHWLFEHIRKKNAAKLKNICIDQDKQRHSQIVALSKQFDEESNSNRARNKMAQRYLNQSYVARKQKGETNPQSSWNENNIQNRRSQSNSLMDKFRKTSSSEMSHYFKSSRKEGRSQGQKQQLGYINDYEYSYCPDPQAEERRKRFKFANNKLGVLEQTRGRKMDSAKKSKTNQYRIRQEQKPQKTSPVFKTLAKRLPTVSEQQPLVEPKKFALC